MVIERTVVGMGYELIDIERAQHGLLRITIDRIPGRVYAGGEGESVTVDDCEQVTRQLQYVLEVEGVDYRRLEVSSPGLDRPLRTAAHYARFAGEQVSLMLKAPFEGRKHYQGRLEMALAPARASEAAEESAPQGNWRIVFMDGKVEKALDFAMEEVRELRLVPQVDFKGRRKTVPAPAVESSEGDRKE